MEWTGARYADAPTVEVETWVAAAPEQVWRHASDVAAMPGTSPELQRVEWQDGATGPAVGASFVGYNSHPALGSWEARSWVVECEEPRVFGWRVGDRENPAASWRFTLEPEGDGTRVRYWAQIGPGPSGLSMAIERMPDKEQKIVFVRLREFETNMTGTLAAIKKRIEEA